MKKLVIVMLCIMAVSACEKKEEPVPTATGSYTGTYTGHVSPQAVQGVCTADFVEKDLKMTGTMVFKNLNNGDASIPFSGTISGNNITAMFPASGIGNFPASGTITSDRKTIEMSVNPAPVFNLKWTLTKDQKK